jgi:predicted ATPase with chaperone activity
MNRGPRKKDSPAAPLPHYEGGDFAEVRGQEHVKRALEVAAAGGHHVLLIGPPNIGESLPAKLLPSILPPLSGTEAAETNRAHAAASLARPAPLAIPFRDPHHRSSPESVLLRAALKRRVEQTSVRQAAIEAGMSHGGVHNFVTTNEMPYGKTLASRLVPPALGAGQ